jgi:putative transposase
VDLGVNRLATLSNGETFEGPKRLRKELSKLRRLSSRALSRKEEGSRNRLKAKSLWRGRLWLQPTLE